MIDVHLLVVPETDKTLLKKCIESLANEPIELHILDGVDGHLGEGRAKALRCGSNEWVGWVDPDDFIFPGAYQKLLNVANTDPNPPFAWMNEEIWYLNPDNMDSPIDTRISTTPHHIHIIHRDLIDYTEIESVISDFCPMLFRMATQGKHIDEVGYVWRKYHTSSCNRRRLGVPSVKAKRTI